MKLATTVTVLCLGFILPARANVWPFPMGPFVRSADVRLDVCEGKVTVDAAYDFDRSYSGRSFRACVEMMADSTMGAAELLSAFVTCEHRPRAALEVAVSDSLWSWPIEFGQGDTCRVELRYRQRLSSRRLTYVLPRTVSSESVEDQLDGLGSFSIVASLPDSIGTPAFSWSFHREKSERGRQIFRCWSKPAVIDTLPSGVVRARLTDRIVIRW